MNTYLVTDADKKDQEIIFASDKNRARTIFVVRHPGAKAHILLEEDEGDIIIHDKTVNCADYKKFCDNYEE